MSDQNETAVILAYFTNNPNLESYWKETASHIWTTSARSRGSYSRSESARRIVGKELRLVVEHELGLGYSPFEELLQLTINRVDWKGIANYFLSIGDIPYTPTVT